MGAQAPRPSTLEWPRVSPKPRGSHHWIEMTLRDALQGLARRGRAREAAGDGTETGLCRTR